MLPTGYTQLEYIESSGTQYIDTGFKANGNTRVTCEFEYLKSSTDNLCIFGGRTSATSKNYSFNYSGGTFRSDYNNTYSQTWSVTATGRKTVDKNKNVTTFNGEQKTYTASTFQCAYNMYLFGLNNAGTFGWKSSVRIYSCKVYDNGTLIRDFIPCKNESGIIGMYDEVNREFYQNSGTGVFIAGTEVITTPDNPTGLKQALNVLLKWNAVECEGYKIRRNGGLIATVKENRYLDEDVGDGQEFLYSITAYNGEYESESITLTATIKEGYTVLTPLVNNAFFQ